MYRWLVIIETMAVDANTAYYISLTSKFTRRCSKIPIFRRFYYSRNVQYPLSCRMFVFLYVFEMHTGPYSAVLGCFVYSWEWSHYSLDSCWLWIVFAVSLLTFIINDEVVILLTVHSPCRVALNAHRWIKPSVETNDKPALGISFYRESRIHKMNCVPLYSTL